MTKKININFDQWWNDGGNKFKKLIFLFSSWWADGNSKLIKAIFVSLAVHFIFAIFWILFEVLNSSNDVYFTECLIPHFFFQVSVRSESLESGNKIDGFLVLLAFTTLLYQVLALPAQGHIEVCQSAVIFDN